jgi:serralysin
MVNLTPGAPSNFDAQDINGLLSGYAWSIGDITYSFPTAASNYGSFYGNGEPYSGFHAFSAAQQDVVRYALNLVSQYTLLTFTETAETDDTHALLRFADSSVPATSTGNYPYPYPDYGDVWLGNVASEVPTKGGYAFDTILHEIGHTLGLKHGQDYDPVYGVLPPQHMSSEWSIMTYYSYVGGTGLYENADGSGNQTYMIDDIAALQYMYGANYSTNSGDTVYTWSPTTGETFIDGVGQGPSSANKVYEAIWDGGGFDTYDLSNYSTNLLIDLRPGEWSTFSTTQLANLDGVGGHLAHGNVANTYLYFDDPSSLIEAAIGGSGNDTLIGNQTSNLLEGGGGNDTIEGNEGNDFLVGDAGNDTLYGSFGDDIMDGGAGGSDTVSYGDAAGSVTVSLALEGDYQYTIGAGSDALFNFENLTGSAYNDTLSGDANANILSGLDGNDAIIGAAGNDTLSGAAGNDTLSGGPGDDMLNGGVGNDAMDGGAAGSDTASYADATSAVTVTLARQGIAQNTVGAGSDTLTNIENLSGSAFNDTLGGDANANILSGLAGNDILNGGAGNDTLTGLTGNDTLNRGAGNDSMDGGAAGSDTASYADAAGAVTVSLVRQGAAQNTIGAGTDTLANFENLTGSAFNDTLTGDGNANILSGLAGNDALNGGAGNDTLTGAAGNDTLIGGLGNDVMDGGPAGSDTASYADAAAAVSVSPARQGSAQNTLGGGTDTLTNFENLTGSARNDTLAGDGNANIVNGLAGNDVLTGNGGNDTLMGAAGNDTLYGNAGADSFVFDAAFGRDTITDFAATGAGHDMINFSTSMFASYAAVRSHMAQVGPNVVITHDGSNAITLKGVKLASLSAADFSFHASAPGLPAAAPSAAADAAPAPAEHLWADHSAQFNTSLHLA